MAWAPGEDRPVSSGSLVGAEPPAAMEEEEEQPAQEVRPAGWTQGPASFSGESCSQEGGLQSNDHTELLVLPGGGGSPGSTYTGVPVRASGCLGLRQSPGRGSPTQTHPFPPQTNADPAGTSGAAETVPRAPPGEPQNLCSCSQDHAVLGGEGGPLLGLWTGPAAPGMGGSQSPW